MKEGAPTEIRLADYKAPTYTTTDVALTFDIHDGRTTVSSDMTIRRLQDDAGVLLLNGQDLTLVSVSVNGQTLQENEYQVDDESLTLLNLDASEETFQVSIVTEIVPEENTALEGLYRSSQMYCTQCEAEGFRKITYYQDRPDVLARFKTTVIADQTEYPNLLANGNCVDTQSLADGRHSATWEDPFPKPSYLFALVAGNLAHIEDTFTTCSGREIKLQIFSEPHNIGQCDYAMDVLKRSMAWDEERFGREYDLDIFMIVAVEDFNMGAMENKGLNIFNTSCVLASPDTATDAAYQRVEAVVAHEYFHNWSGNRVTCRDWFQLSLKEGFTVFRDAEFSSDMNSRGVKRIEDVAFLRAVQFAEDAGPLAHPVRPASYLEISNFYTVTIYEKGAEVVGMYETLLGADAFRAGSDLYFDRHDGQAVTTDDFAQAMADVSGRDLTQFKRWYDQAGTPVLTVSQAWEEGSGGQVLTVDIAQACAPTPGQDEKLPFHIPIVLGLVNPDGSEVNMQNVQVKTDSAVLPKGDTSILIELCEASTTVSFEGLAVQPVVSLLRGFSAPVRVNFTRGNQELAVLAQHDSDGFVAWDALQTLWLGLFEDHSADAGLVVDLLGGILSNAINTIEDAEQSLLAAKMLAVPEENYLLEQLDEFEVWSLLDRRQALVSTLAQQHKDQFNALYEAARFTGEYKSDAASMAKRGLYNLAFAYLCEAVEGPALDDLVWSHYTAANNLTDRRAALAQACMNAAVGADTRQKLIDDFYNNWQSEALVLDMWFNLQAQSTVGDIADLEALEAHERFDMKNPNRARSVFGAFGMFNHRKLHNPDGSGYRYLAGAVGRMDKLNPQIAARLAVPLTRWQRYDKPRQQLMRGCLESLAQAQDISKDLYEIVSKSLAV